MEYLILLSQMSLQALELYISISSTTFKAAIGEYALEALYLIIVNRIKKPCLLLLILLCCENWKHNGLFIGSRHGLYEGEWD